MDHASVQRAAETAAAEGAAIVARRFGQPGTTPELKGAAAVDLAWVAAGVVTDWAGGPKYLSGNVIAGSPATHAVLLQAVRKD